MPYMVLLIKNVYQQLNKLRKFFTFEVTIIDDKNIKRKFKACNFKVYYIYNQSLIRIKQNNCEIPLKLEDGWNQIIVDLADFTYKALNTIYKETLK